MITTQAATTVEEVFNIFEDFTYNSVKLDIIDTGDSVWFKAKDIASILKYARADHAIRMHVEDEYKNKLGNFVPLNLRGTGIKLVNRKNKKETIYMNELGLFSLIMASKLHDAKVFMNWITGMVIPSIRKTGTYENEELIRKLTQKDKQLGECKIENTCLKAQIQLLISKVDTVIDQNEDLKSGNEELTDDIQHVNTRLVKVIEVVVPPNKHHQLREIFTLIKLRSDYTYTMSDPTHYKDSEYVTIRCQRVSVNSALRRILKAGNGSNVDAKMVSN